MRKRGIPEEMVGVLSRFVSVIIVDVVMESVRNGMWMTWFS